jgi:hypothetical protein
MKGTDIGELMDALTDPDFKKAVRQEAAELIAEKKNRGRQRKVEIVSRPMPVAPPPGDSDSSDSEQFVATEPDDEPRRKPLKKCQNKGPVSHVPKPREVSQEVWESWSEAHRVSYTQRIQNPNSYLYRNNPPGEKQRSGAWSEDERKLFMRRLEEMKRHGVVEGQWGIFSEAIPGRVGYQCSNFYRKLIMDGVIKDPSYKIGQDGRLHYKDRGGYKKGPRATSTTSSPQPKRVKSQTKIAAAKEESRESREVTYYPQLSKYEMMAKENPIKGQIDFITGEEIQVAAVSPSGTVLDYNTWMKILMDSKQDPFTRQRVNKRQIVVLNHENFEEYRQKIRLC